ADGKRRISVETWGKETSLNDYAHCQNVLLVGVIHQSPLALAGRYLGQVGDLKANVSKDLISDLVHSEVCHAVYQALSRGSCRVMDNGKAKPMRAWVIDKDKEIER